MKDSPSQRGSAAAPSSAAAALRPFIDSLAGNPPNFEHARRLLHDHGMVQFAIGTDLHMEHGYCLDDNARAFLVAVLSLHLHKDSQDARTLGDASLDFMEGCRRPDDGRFHNLMAEDGTFTDEVGSQESLARTLWACGVASRSALPEEWRERSARLLALGLARIGDLTELRPKAYAMLGLAAAIEPERASLVPPLGDIPPALKREARETLADLSAGMSDAFMRNARPDWDWWEPALTWGNARLPDAILRSATALSDSKLEAIGMRALNFLAAITHERDIFIPIGNDGWYERGKTRALYDQQPIEACCMVDAWLAASRTSQGALCHSKALEAFGWFFGMNTEKIVMVDECGGCYDGLERGGFNRNMGAESTLSYLQAHAAIALSLKSK